MTPKDKAELVTHVIIWLVAGLLIFGGICSLEDEKKEEKMDTLKIKNKWNNKN